MCILKGWGVVADGSRRKRYILYVEKKETNYITKKQTPKNSKKTETKKRHRKKTNGIDKIELSAANQTGMSTHTHNTDTHTHCERIYIKSYTGVCIIERPSPDLFILLFFFFLLKVAI